MDNFEFILPLKKDQKTKGTLVGVASTTSMDRDEERMSSEALRDMVRDIKSLGVNLFGNHEHSWENTLGVLTDADVLPGDLVGVKIDLDDEKTNLKVPMLLNKLARGIKLGLSVGGNVTKSHVEYDKLLNKKINVIDSVKLYEVSVVGIPSNSDCFISIPQAIMKSQKQTCPACLSPMYKSCNICLYER